MFSAGWGMLLFQHTEIHSLKNTSEVESPQEKFPEYFAT